MSSYGEASSATGLLPQALWDSAPRACRKLKSTHMRYRIGISALLAAVGLPAQVTTGDVTRATLDNGLRVVIIRDALAPVATVEENYLVGANEVPAGFAG